MAVVERVVVVGAGSSSGTPKLECQLRRRACRSCSEAARDPLHSRNHRNSTSLLLQCRIADVPAAAPRRPSVSVSSSSSPPPSPSAAAAAAATRDGDDGDSNGEADAAHGRLGFLGGGGSGSSFNLLIDCGKTFREAALKVFPRIGVADLHAVLLTHGHAAACLGLDDLRDLSNPSRPLHVYADPETTATVRRVFPHLFPASNSPSAAPSGECGGDEAAPWISSSLRWHTFQCLHDGRGGGGGDGSSSGACALGHRGVITVEAPPPPHGRGRRRDRDNDSQHQHQHQHHRGTSGGSSRSSSSSCGRGGGGGINSNCDGGGDDDDANANAPPAALLVAPLAVPHAADSSANAFVFPLGDPKRRCFAAYISHVSSVDDALVQALDDALGSLAQAIAAADDTAGPSGGPSDHDDDDDGDDDDDDPSSVTLSLLLLDMLGPRPHPSHLSLEDALEAARRIGAAETVFVGMSHELEFAQTTELLRKRGVGDVASLGWDGRVVYDRARAASASPATAAAGAAASRQPMRRVSVASRH